MRHKRANAENAAQRPKRVQRAGAKIMQERVRDRAGGKMRQITRGLARLS